MRPIAIAALLVLALAACSSHSEAPPEARAPDANAIAPLDAAADAGDEPGDAADAEGPDRTFELTVSVPCAASSLQADTTDGGVTYGLSASWRMPDGSTVVKALTLSTTPRDESLPVTFCFYEGNGARHIAESIGTMTGDAFFHPSPVQPGAHCTSLRVAAGLTRALPGQRPCALYPDQVVGRSVRVTDDSGHSFLLYDPRKKKTTP